jgi:hypothetical protein
MVGFGFSGDSSTFKTNYDKLCSQQDAFLTSSRQSAEKIRIANKNLAREFRKCVAGKPFSAWLQPTDTQTISDHRAVSSHQSDSL